MLTKLVKMYFKPYGLLRYTPYLLIIPIAVFYALCLAGCASTSPGIPNIYAVALRANGSPNSTADSPLQVRIGYFGICGISDDEKRCETASGRSVETLAVDLFPELVGGNRTRDDDDDSSAQKNKPNKSKIDPDVADLVTTGLDLQSRTFTPILAGGAVFFIAGLVAFVLFQRDVRRSGPLAHPRRSAIIRRATYGTLYGSAALAFAAAIATSQAAGALESASHSMAHASVLVKSGTTLQVLQWLTFGFESLFILAVPFLVRGGAGADEGEFKGEP
ncbi:hypothetical protein VTH82DRAFT_5326 [Thermothelomyces myriococcoides]